MESQPNTTTRFDRQLALWTDWKDTGSTESLDDLMESLTPAIVHHASKYRNAPIPFQAIKAEGYRLAGKALETYKPGKAAIGTHVDYYLRKLYRYVGNHQNTGRIPESKIQLISPYNTAVTELTESLGRDPDELEIATHMNIPQTQVRDLRRMVRKDYTLEPEADVGRGDDSVVRNYTPKDLLEMTRYELDETENRIMDSLLSGKSTQDIAIQENKSPRWVSSVRLRISNILKEKVSKL